MKAPDDVTLTQRVKEFADCVDAQLQCIVAGDADAGNEYAKRYIDELVIDDWLHVEQREDGFGDSGWVTHKSWSRQAETSGWTSAEDFMRRRTV